MAIEFDCPYCTATIRVPDAYGGKQGRCPKCDTRLLVPLVVRPGSTTVPDASSSPITANQSPAIPGALPQTEIFAVPAPPTSPVRHRRPARRRPSRALVVGMPVLGFLILLAVIFFSVTGSLPELSGELVARRIEEKNLPGVTIPWADTGLSPDDQTTLRDFLAMTPETLQSEIMTCRLIGTADGIEVRLTAGAGNEWFAVDTSANKALALWLKKERAAINTKRIALLHENLADYCRDKLAQIGGEKLQIDGLRVRDNVGINASGNALSFVVMAEAANRQIPCSYEDDKGTLYFCLPRETQSFPIRGRTLSDKSKPFAGEFTGVVSGISRPPVGTPEADSSTKKKDADSTEMAPDGEMSSESSEEKMSTEEPSDSNMDSGEGEMDDTGMGTPKKKAMMDGDEMGDSEMSDEKMGSSEMDSMRMESPGMMAPGMEKSKKKPGPKFDE
jgi:hypothetical protein